MRKKAEREPRRRRIARRIAFALALVLVLYIGANAVSIVRYASVDETRSADVAIVLGAGTSEGEVSAVYRGRLDHALELYENGTVGKIIVTGGVGEGQSISDAEAAREHLIACGVDRAAILFEEGSTITQENIDNSARIMERGGLTTALIVSDPLHMKRAMTIARDAGIEAYSSPTTASAYKSLRTKAPFLLPSALKDSSSRARALARQRDTEKSISANLGIFFIFQICTFDLSGCFPYNIGEVKTRRSKDYEN